MTYSIWIVFTRCIFGNVLCQPEGVGCAESTDIMYAWTFAGPVPWPMPGRFCCCGMNGPAPDICCMFAAMAAGAFRGVAQNQNVTTQSHTEVDQ